MTTKEIHQAIDSGRTVVMKDDPKSCICRDIFGDLVVVSRNRDGGPVRLATTSDKRKAIVI